MSVITQVPGVLDAADWQRIGRVYRAGAVKSRQWPFNIERQQQGDVLAAQADECDKIAAELGGVS